MSDSRRWGSGLISWLAAPAAAVMVALVLSQPERDYWADHLCLSVVFATAAAWYLRDARLLAGAAAFALATTWLNLGPPVGPDPLWSMMEPPPPPPAIQKAGAEKEWADWWAVQQRDARRRLDVFVGLNGLAFLGLLAVDRRMRRRAGRRAPAPGRIAPTAAPVIVRAARATTDAREETERGPELEKIDRSRRGRGPLVLALEERGHVGFGAPRRRRSSEGRGIMGSYVLAVPLLAMFCGVYAFPMRSFEGDGLLRVVLIGTAAVWYLRVPRLAAYAVAFAVFTWCLDPGLPDSFAAPLEVVGIPSWFTRSTTLSNTVARPPTSFVPTWNSPAFPILEALDFKWQQRRTMSHDAAQDQMFRFLALNGIWFTCLMGAAAVGRVQDAVSEAEAIRAVARRGDARPSRSRA